MERSSIATSAFIANSTSGLGFALLRKRSAFTVDFSATRTLSLALRRFATQPEPAAGVRSTS
jgi:hypothetical protein